MLRDPINKENDVARVAALQKYNVLYTDKEEEYDQITQLASQITDMPISLISFVDEDDVWYKSTKGMDLCAVDRDLSFCSYAIEANNTVFILEDIKNNPQYKNHPFVNLEENPVQFYAGVCLIDREGHKLGTLCVIDNKPNKISDSQVKSLKTLAKQVVKLIELHQANYVLNKIKKSLQNKNTELKSFAGVVSHDMKMPLANIIITTDILKAKYSKVLDTNAKEHLKSLKRSSFSLSDYITGLLEHYESDQHSNNQVQEFDIHELLEEIIDSLNIDFECDINFPEKNIELNCNKEAIKQILFNLIANSLKYNDKSTVVIDIDCQEQSLHYYFKITDNGTGIPKDKQKDIFTLFSTLGKKDRRGNTGNGIGLSTVKKIVERFGGEIVLTSDEDKGTKIEFTIAKEIIF